MQRRRRKTKSRNGVRLQAPAAKLLARERVCRVATAGKGGVPHVVPVCHVVAGGKLYFGSEGGAKKVEHLRANPHVAVTVDEIGRASCRERV